MLHLEIVSVSVPMLGGSHFRGRHVHASQLSQVRQVFQDTHLICRVSSVYQRIILKSTRHARMSWVARL